MAKWGGTYCIPHIARCPRRNGPPETVLQGWFNLARWDSHRKKGIHFSPSYFVLAPQLPVSMLRFARFLRQATPSAATATTTPVNLQNNPYGKAPTAPVVLPRFDVCVIGGGPSGIRAAMRAIDFGKKVCLIEKNRLGGADLWNGALQSKTLWEMSRFCSKLRNLGPRIYHPDSIGVVHVDQDSVLEQLQRTSEKREAQFKQLLLQERVTMYFGPASFLSPERLCVRSPDEGDLAIEADYFIIATGSSPRKHPTINVNQKSIVTSDDIMKQKFPKSLVIVGAGVIGCEFASIFANFGTTQVNVIEKTKRILPHEDEDVASYIQALLTKRGVQFHHECSLKNLQSVDPKTEDEKCIASDHGEFVRYTTKNLTTGEERRYDVERALISIGRNAHYDGLGLENLGATVKDGKIECDDFSRVEPHEHIYAVGDATVDIALVNMGETEACAAIEHMYSPEWRGMPKTDNLSTIMFLDEEVAGVGYNEKKCRELNIGYVVARYDYTHVSRALAMGNTNGFIKILATNNREKRILGVRAIGEHASSIVEMASMAVHKNMSAYSLADTLTAYPAVTQGFQECVRLLLGNSMFKPGASRPLIDVTAWPPPNFERGRVYQGSPKKQSSQSLGAFQSPKIVTD
mgnify:FL=1